LFDEIMPAEIVWKAVMSAWINQVTDKANDRLEPKLSVFRKTLNVGFH